MNWLAVFVVVSIGLWRLLRALCHLTVRIVVVVATVVGRVVVVVGVPAGLALWRLACRRFLDRALERRVAWVTLPAEDFAPSGEEVRRFVARLARLRPSWWCREAAAIRLRLDAGGGGRVTYGIEGPQAAAGIIQQGYSGVSLRRASPRRRVGQRQRRRTYVARAELTLAHDAIEPLRELPLEPDPLGPFVRALAQATKDESVSVMVDVLPLGHPGRWAALARARHRKADPWAQVPTSRRRRDRGLMEAIEAAQRRSEVKELAPKLTGVEPLFGLQVLVCASSSTPGRAVELASSVVGAFSVFDGRNYLRVVGQRLGWRFAGTDAFGWRRKSFDRRLATGLFVPRRRTAVVSGAEIAGFAKPPTKGCRGEVARAIEVPAAPISLPTYRGQRDLLPLGVVVSVDGIERLVGVALADSVFSLTAGRAGCGKTESALGRFLSVARAGEGAMFVDPHADAVTRALPYLTDCGERVILVDLSPRGRSAHQVGWNLISMQGAGIDDIEARVAAVTASFAAALGWTERNTRAQNLVTMATRSLCELGLCLPPDAAPTIFQITTILSDDDWREAVLPRLSPYVQQFWRTRFEKLDYTPVTNLLDRLRSNSSTAALFGASRSTYDVRAAMDQGAIVLACPAGLGDLDRICASLFCYDLYRAALCRRDTPVERRRPFHAWIDEVQLADAGQASHSLAAMVRECRKYGLRLHAMTQQPVALSDTTRGAMLTNRSHLLAGTVGTDSARLLVAEWAAAVNTATLTTLARHHFLASVTHQGEVTPPFLCRGLALGELAEVWGHSADPDGLAELMATIDARRRPIAETLEALDTLDERILAALPRRRRVPLEPSGEVA